ncbi:hypothetical protein DET49_13521 [Salegentibacter sp. 24]|jgi:hypothetical protein|uniref:hypothetical protein n=1 Tax=Salegentibacter sp. 24 TaxID=2183986 RepID=UPI00105FA2CA|nr:hypothetical protein [Salegentibacter sp. 24]TDN79839.1 hypothetical protein DET49_13521 [Salegentibacter sp. 24]
MRLVYLQNTDKAYVAKAEIFIKVFGVGLGRKTKVFIREDSDKKWREEKTNKIASRKESAFLDKWLKDHQKFVEHY